MTRDGRAVVMRRPDTTPGWCWRWTGRAGRNWAATAGLRPPRSGLPGALVRVERPRRLVIQRLDPDGWTTLPTAPGDGWVTADRIWASSVWTGSGAARVTRLLGNVPNPFNPETEIRFEVSAADAAGSCELAVYDVRGRLVRTLHCGPLTAGAQAADLGRPGRRGQRQASGVYFYRLSTASCRNRPHAAAQVGGRP